MYTVLLRVQHQEGSHSKLRNIATFTFTFHERSVFQNHFILAAPRRVVLLSETPFPASSSLLLPIFYQRNKKINEKRMLSKLVSIALGSLDLIYYFTVKVVRGPKFLSKGYGDVNKVYRLQENLCDKVKNGEVQHLKLEEKDIEWLSFRTENVVHVRKGKFTSPAAASLPDESKYCYFHHVMPKKQEAKVTVIMMPATGEVGTGTRLRMARTLARQHGYASIIVNAPYYGKRKPKGQFLFFLNTVEDLLLSSQAIVQEGTALAYYARNTTICFSGFSWGGSMSSVASVLSKSAHPEIKIACASYVGSASPACVVDGLVHVSIDLRALQKANKHSSEEEARRTLEQELYKTQLCTLTDHLGSKSIQIDSIYAVNMHHDHIIRPRYAKDFHSQLKVVSKTYEVSSSTGPFFWMPGGHVSAALFRLYYHPRLIVRAVSDV